MITESLTWAGRINLWLRLGQAQVPTLREATVYFRAIEKVRPTDEEKREINFQTTDRGFQWNPLRENFGSRIFDFEDDEAEAIVRVLESETSAVPFNAQDSEWMNPLIADIRSKLPNATQTNGQPDAQNVTGHARV